MNDDAPFRSLSLSCFGPTPRPIRGGRFPAAAAVIASSPFVKLFASSVVWPQRSQEGQKSSSEKTSLLFCPSRCNKVACIARICEASCIPENCRKC